MLRKRAGFYLGMKQNLCFYGPRGTWKSSGIASEGGYYNDLLAVYQTIRGKYEPEQIWVSGACSGCVAVAVLKKTTKEGFNLICENGFSDLRRDFLARRPAIVKWFAWCFRAGLSARDIPQSKLLQQTGFSIEEAVRDATPLRGKMVMVRRAIIVGIIAIVLIRYMISKFNTESLSVR